MGNFGNLQQDARNGKKKSPVPSIVKGAGVGILAGAMILGGAAFNEATNFDHNIAVREEFDRRINEMEIRLTQNALRNIASGHTPSSYDVEGSVNSAVSLEAPNTFRMVEDTIVDISQNVAGHTAAGAARGAGIGGTIGAGVGFGLHMLKKGKKSELETIASSATTSAAAAQGWKEPEEQEVEYSI